MNEFLFFLLGLIIGGLSGVVVICFVIFNRLTDNNLLQGYFNKHEKKNN